MISNLLSLLTYENIYFIANWGVIPFWLLLIFFLLTIIYFAVVDDETASNDPSWITLDEIIGMSLASLASPSQLLPLITGFIIFRASDILKQPNMLQLELLKQFCFE